MWFFLEYRQLSPQLLYIHRIILICKNISNSHFITHSGHNLSPSNAHFTVFWVIFSAGVSVATSWLSTRKVYFSLVMAFLLRHCLTLPCLFLFHLPQPLCPLETAGSIAKPLSVSLTPGLPWTLSVASVPNPLRLRHRDSPAFCQHRRVGYLLQLFIASKMKIIFYGVSKSLISLIYSSWMSPCPLNLNTGHLFTQKSQTKLLGNSFPLSPSE